MRLHVEDLVDHLRVDRSTLHLHLQFRQSLSRLISEQKRGDEGEERTRQHASIDRLERA